MTPTMQEQSTSPRAARSREKMLRAATGLLVESGPRSVTVDAVAETSGVAKSTLYRHWSSRNELLVDVVRCNQPTMAAPDLAAGFEPALREFVRSVADALSDPDWSCVFAALVSLRQSMPELDAFITADKAARQQVLTEILALGVAEGTLSEMVDSDDAGTLLAGPLVLAAITGRNNELERLADYVVDRFLSSYRD